MDAKQRIKDKLRSAYNREDRIANGVAELENHAYTLVTPIEKWEIKEAIYHGPGEYDWNDKKWRAAGIGDPWGGENITGFFRARCSVPVAFKGKPLYLRIRLGGEGLLKINGKPFHGLDPEHQIVFVEQKATGREKLSLEIEAYVRQMFEQQLHHQIYVAEMLSIDREMEDIYYDFFCAHEVALIEDIDPQLRVFLLDNIEDALRLVDTYETDHEKYVAAARRARKMLQDTVYSTDRFKSAGKLALVSNCHIDLVYMWPYREFLRKIARSHSSQLNLLREFPEFIFSQSQPKMYDDIKELYPDIYAGIKDAIKKGRWEPLGAMYVEPDCNLVSGESFIRQILFGQRFQQKEFGKTTNTCWLPDVFGNSWIMPQILSRCGVKYFVTNKLVVWNDTNEFPYNSFMWQGVDGTQVLTNFPNTHFGAGIEIDILHLNWKEYKEKRETGEAMCNYGHGDGRGGPKREDMLIARRLADFPGMPRCKIDYAESFFARLAENKKTLPVWDNELYLETHRGTYTTQAELKKSNRRCELLYRDAEALSSIATLLGEKYPQESINRGWKHIMKNQFHDILPGSHVTQACKDAREDYRHAFLIGSEAHYTAACNISCRIAADGPGLTVFNTSSWVRSDVVTTMIPLAEDVENLNAVSRDGDTCPVQILGKERGMAKVIFTAKNVPPMGYKVFTFEPAADKPAPEFTCTDKQLENAFFRIKLDGAGFITSILHKETGRETLKGGKGNVFQLFEDKPGRYSAWDIISAYKEKEWKIDELDAQKVLENGPVRVVLRQMRSFMQSKIVQDVIIYNDIPRIDFFTKVNWREREKMLKVGFPVDVFARSATYDLSMGNIERPTHTNTKWDAAKFEVCGHQWADLSEPGFGVSLLNDCKYGHDTRGNLMRLTLLRGTTAPDPTADFGMHEFTYSLYPHAGNWREAATAMRAFELNSPMFAMPIEKQTGKLPAQHSFVTVDATNVLISALKKAEDSKHIIIRVYENHGARGPVTITFDRAIKTAVECNPIEAEEGKAKFAKNALKFSIKPYEIKTFKVSL